MSVRSPGAAATIAAVALLSACSFSPLAHHIKIGEDPFVVFVAEGIDQHTDLFAVPANGGVVSQVTFTPMIERGPRLSPAGEVVAFIRMRDTLAGSPRDVVLMNLLSGGDKIVPLPAGAGQPQAVAWSDNGTKLYIRTDRALWQTVTPPAALNVVAVTPADAAPADSALDRWLGLPRFSRAIACATGGICVIGPKGDTALLAPLGHDAIRWGTDSVGWFEGDAIVVRSLGPGHERRVTWTDGPGHPRDGSYARPLVPGEP